MASIGEIAKNGIELNGFSNRVKLELENKLNCKIPDYDGLYIKKLNKSDSYGGSQAHIAIGKNAFDMFPRVKIENYLDKNRSSFKRRYSVKVSSRSSKNNMDYLANTPITSPDVGIDSFFYPLVSKHNSDQQIELYSKKIDGADFQTFRKNLKENNYLIIFKEKNELNYYFFQMDSSFFNGLITTKANNTVINDKIRKSYEYLLANESKFYKEDKLAEIFGVPNKHPVVEKKFVNYLKRNYYCLKYAEFVKAYNKSLDYYVDYKKVDYNNLKNITKFSLEEDMIKMERNRIIYGAPGTGKSFKLQEDLERCLISKANYNRVTFYPGFSYGQFVGSYKPKPDVENNITYEYTPGVFIRTLVSALENPSEDYVLIIEEINRSKADSVFGDVFQILDRDDDGESEYGITPSEEMLNYLLKNKKIKIGKDYELKIPSNMYLWATMNSADQGVYPMDTAFKRRWTFEHIGLNENEDKFCGLHSNNHNDYLISYKNQTEDGEKKMCYVSWNDFRRSINSILLNSSNISEDRLLAPFFIKQNDFNKNSQIVNGDKKYIIKLESFQSKILMYLFDDLLRHKKNSEIFTDKINSFSELKNGSVNPFSEDPKKLLNCIFHATLLSKLQDCNSFVSKLISE